MSSELDLWDLSEGHPKARAELLRLRAAEEALERVKEEATTCPKCGRVLDALDHYLFYATRVIGRTSYPELHCTKEPAPSNQEDRG